MIEKLDELDLESLKEKLLRIDVFTPEKRNQLDRQILTLKTRPKSELYGPGGDYHQHQKTPKIIRTPSNQCVS